MEYVPGKTLRDILRDDSRLSPARAANFIYPVAEGLEAAHRIGIVHRDLKPDNIMVMTDENGVDRCKVVDFGIAKVVNSTQTQLTQTGMLIGTPEYMSPEQVLGEALDGRSDVYALALVAYNAFTGTLPSNSGTPERTLAARLIEDPPELSQVAPELTHQAGWQLRESTNVQSRTIDLQSRACRMAVSARKVPPLRVRPLCENNRHSPRLARLAMANLVELTAPPDQRGVRGPERLQWLRPNSTPSRESLLRFPLFTTKIAPSQSLPDCARYSRDWITAWTALGPSFISFRRRVLQTIAREHAYHCGRPIR